jgi:hypothetical protein
MSRKAVNSWVPNDSLMTKRLKSKMQKWLRQQSEDFYAARFDALVKRWGKCINVSGGYVVK